MFDHLLGEPGETSESIARTIELMMRSGADRIGVTIGARVYPDPRLVMMGMPRHYSSEMMVSGDGAGYNFCATFMRPSKLFPRSNFRRSNTNPTCSFTRVRGSV
jgi:hypothetical protein